jgi:hypothetical protein
VVIGTVDVTVPFALRLTFAVSDISVIVGAGLGEVAAGARWSSAARRF